MQLDGRATGIWLDDASAVPIGRKAPAASLARSGRAQSGKLVKLLRQAWRNQKSIADNSVLHG
jgi:hypothetical protein